MDELTGGIKVGTAGLFGPEDTPGAGPTFDFLNGDPDRPIVVGIAGLPPAGPFAGMLDGDPDRPIVVGFNPNQPIRSNTTDFV